jgi:acetoacetate decarboxylase
MSQNRWVREPTGPGGNSDFHPTLPSIEVSYLSDPEAVAAVIPPPLGPGPDPRVHARVTDIKLEFGDFVYEERVGYFAVDAVYDGVLGEYPLTIPIDLESAVAISRERFGEPKKLAQIAFSREGDHVHASVTRNGVTYIEITGDVVGPLPTPDPYPATQWWFKFSPAVSGEGFDAGPFLIRVDQVRSPELVEQVDGTLELRDLATDPVVDLPIREIEHIHWTRRTSTHQPTMVGPIDAASFAPFVAARYDTYA